MSALPVRLPPSSRDFEIYRLVTIQEVSQRETARQVKLSPTRVRQIIAKVEQFLAEPSMPESELSREQKLRVAEVIASERVNLLFGQALRGWEQSQGEQTSIRTISKEGQPMTRIETTQSSAGKVQYLNAALRYAQAAAKLPPASLMTMGWPEDDAEMLAAIEQQEAEEAQEVEEGQTIKANVPPIGDCAPPAIAAVKEARMEVPLLPAKRFEETGYGSVLGSVGRPSERMLTPAQRRARQGLFSGLREPVAA